MQSPKEKQILVTGATGFIGSRVVEYLVECGYDNIVAVGRQPKEWTPDVVLERLVRCDLVQDDLGALEPADFVIHLAAQQPSTKAEWEDYYQANVASLMSLLPLARSCLVYISTGSVYDSFGRENPINLYGLSKLTAEKLLEIETRKRTNFLSVVLRLPAVIGANHRKGLVHEFCDAASKGNTLELFSRGRPYRNLLHVDSAAEAIEQVICSYNYLDRFDRFNIGSKDSMRICDIARLLVRLIGSDSRVLLLDRKATYDVDFFLETSKAVSKIGFNPLTVEQGIMRYLRQLGYEI